MYERRDIAQVDQQGYRSCPKKVKSPDIRSTRSATVSIRKAANGMQVLSFMMGPMLQCTLGPKELMKSSGGRNEGMCRTDNCNGYLER